jgi:hypothetical protein
LLGFLYTQAVVLPLLARGAAGGVPGGKNGTTLLHEGDIELQSQVPSFAAAFPRTQSQILVEKMRPSRKRETKGLSTRAQAFAFPFGQIETPLESEMRRRREAWEDRLCLSV